MDFQQQSCPGQRSAQVGMQVDRGARLALNPHACRHHFLNTALLRYSLHTLHSLMLSVGLGGFLPHLQSCADITTTQFDNIFITCRRALQAIQSAPPGPTPSSRQPGICLLVFRQKGGSVITLTESNLTG